MLRSCLVLFAFCAVPAFPLSAQPLQCASRAKMLDMLAADAQMPQSVGLAGQAVMELFAGPDSAQWTITVTLPDGRTCLLARGTAFESLFEKVPLPGIPS